jgi:hypothetical protein
MRRGAVEGMALGHARLSQRREGERAPVNGELHAALTQLIKQDYDAFVRYGIAQATQGSISEERAQRMIERFPKELMSLGWERITAADVDFEAPLREIDRPLLLARHEGCLVSTEEGFEDAVAAFPDAKTFSTPDAPTVDPAYSDALRSFCEEVRVAAKAAARDEASPADAR